MNGFINLLKPSGMTSSDAVLRVRRLLPRGTAVGHGGTLDPEAAGVLPVCIGKATRLFDYIVDKTKVYTGELLLGVSTDTDDATGRMVSKGDCDVTDSTLAEALKSFTGDIRQVPPMYSALKMSGEPLYKKARKGETTLLEPRSVTIHSIDVVARLAKDRYLLRIVCGKGVYIRSLMRDIGAKLGTCGCMSFLIRTASGALKIEDSVTLDELGAIDDINKAILPMDAMLTSYPKAVLDETMRSKVLNGQSFTNAVMKYNDAVPGDTLRLYVEDDFAGMARIDEDGRVKISAMLLERS
ncbi:MAG: tRNA pseudouridine(55) synthase TruB [Clostridia bacterium]|nr:tRNA pseudouridine(55) synthase TruB [Clostridia bacterium]